MLVDNPYDRPFEGSAAHRARYEYQIGVDSTLPLLHRWGIDVQAGWVIDLGCGSGGLAVAFAESGASCVGIDLRPERIQEGREMAARHGVSVDFRIGDVLNLGRAENCYDLVVLSETVEHLGTTGRVTKLLAWSRQHLSASGSVYVTFPPWYSPFAGHQAGWHRIRHIPWYHLLPDSVKRLLAPSQATYYLKFMEELNHLTIQTFERCVQDAGLRMVRRELYFLRPEYHFRYGVPQLRTSLLGMVPFLREVTTSGAYYLLRPEYGAHSE
jgi:SAM-dependent methyltransferase